MRTEIREHTHEEMEKIRPTPPVKDYGRPLKPIERYNLIFFTSIFVTMGTWVAVVVVAWYMNQLPGVISTPFNLAAWLYWAASLFIGGPLLILWGLRHDVFKSWN